MIEIREISPPRKLSGLSSFLLKFPYNPRIVDVVKSFSPAVFDKKNLTWEISSSYLSQLLDQLTYLDDIQLTLLSGEIKEISFEPLTENEIKSFRYSPYNHQVEAINFGLRPEHSKWLLLDGMGLGKTLEAMYLAEALYNRGEIEHCLIICGVDSLRTNWKKEISKFSNLSCVVLGEYITKTGKTRYKTIPERAKQLKEKISEFFIIINAATIRDSQIIEAFNKSVNKIDMIVVDEAHRMSNASSTQGANLKKLNAKYKLSMTGSLITNNPESCYLPLSWTENDSSTLTNFKSQYCTYGGFGGKQVIGYKNLDLLKEELESCSLRRTFDQVKGNMPKKTVEFETVELSDDHLKLYDAVVNGVKEEVDKVELSTGNLLALTTRLRQATTAPGILTTESINNEKLNRAVEIIEDILSQGEKIVVFSTFIEPCNLLAAKLQKFQPLLATGEIPDDIVQRNIDDFRNSKNYNLLICTHQKAGTGYSMPECHYLLMIDFPWTYYAFSQSCDRIYRITSEQPVFIKALVAQGTIDERVKEIVETKKDLQDYLVDGVNNNISKGLASEMRDILLNL